MNRGCRRIKKPRRPANGWLRCIRWRIWTIPMKRMYAKARELQGQVSGEHGICLVKRPYLKESLPEASFVLMRGIKQVFDPNNILNPHKVCQM